MERSKDALFWLSEVSAAKAALDLPSVWTPYLLFPCDLNLSNSQSLVTALLDRQLVCFLVKDLKAKANLKIQLTYLFIVFFN